jgi:hypothetical protein
MVAIPEPAWLLVLADQRAALVKAAGVTALGFDVVLTPLTEPPENATQTELDIWERSCDNCKGFFPTTLHTGVVRRIINGKPVEFLFGVCPTCKELP